MDEIIEKVDFADNERDHSYEALTNDEKTELALFHSLKQDHYYKHYLRNTIRQTAEEEQDGILDIAKADEPINPDLFDDYIKFDRLNLYDFRRNLPMQKRDAKIDSKSRAYGYSKRKKSRALVRVEPGNGRITVNGKPML